MAGYYVVGVHFPTIVVLQRLCLGAVCSRVLACPTPSPACVPPWTSSDTARGMGWYNSCIKDDKPTCGVRAKELGVQGHGMLVTVDKSPYIGMSDLDVSAGFCKLPVYG
ncbi:uncharacterized protein [Aegilops tauschii subsp. strangulata]|uniref:uncharacterized protein n=1 Tax=Aegilops tauschii subsp. strangulata TaxID=200361 RepID=UPI003CC89A83